MMLTFSESNRDVIKKSHGPVKNNPQRGEKKSQVTDMKLLFLFRSRWKMKGGNFP